MDEIRNHLRVPPRIDSLPLSEGEVREEGKPTWKFDIQGQRFDFQHGKILLNGQNLSEHIKENLTHFGANYWTTLSRRLGAYRDWALAHLDDPVALGRFSALVHAFLTKIFGRVKKKFDETVDGMSFHLEEGQLLVNGINVNAFLALARRKRNERARIFLKGLRNRLTLMLENRTHNPAYEKIRETVERLAQEIDLELKCYTPNVIELPAPQSLLDEPV